MEIKHISLQTLSWTVFLISKSKLDDSAFFWSVNKKLQGAMFCYVDDFCWGGSE